MSSPACEVFLSFRGLDTRNNFADFLYTWLKDVGIEVFRDEEELERGKEILPQLMREIEQSNISIPVISKDYASSKSCLLELKKMDKCMRMNKHTIIPVFYHVDPKEVRDCSGPFKRAFDEHKKRGREGRFVNHWMPAFRRIGNLKGHHLHEKNDMYPTGVIKQIVRKVELMLKKRDLILPKYLVDVNPRVQEIMAKLKIDYRNGKEVKIGDKCKKVLIYGIPGVGKTVLAKCVYNKINLSYDSCGFLEDIQKKIERKDVLSVQNTLISLRHKTTALKYNSSNGALDHIQKRFRNTKVLLVLDNVKDCGQLSALVGELDWLHPGSTVIVTSRRDDVLQNVKGAEKFGLRTMQKDKALQLFRQHAFGKDSPPEHLEELSTKIVAATDGLPLALQMAGKFLSKVKDGKVRKVWTETSNALEQAPEEGVRKAFVKCYKTLGKNEKDIFLDIACFFVGKDQRIPHYMWEDCEFFPSRSIPSLRAMSLVEIGEDEKICMLGILMNFGREIVKNENRNEPYRRSRLWNHREALNVLKRKTGTRKVVALGLEFPDGSTEDNIFESDKFDRLHNLRFLKLDQADVRGNFGDCLSRLRWLDWRPKILDVQSLNLNLQELLILDLSGSQVDKDWRGWELLKKARKLKVLKLTGCVHLFATPKFPASMSLERLILEDSSKLEVFDASFENLTKLVSLNIKGCSLLGELPDLGPMKDLEELVIDGTSISQIDFQEGSMLTLETLSARDCEDLTDISDSIRYLKSLTYLALDRTSIHILPKSIGSLKQLNTLSLNNCQRLTNLPNGIGNLTSLQSLDLSQTAIPELPPSIKDLKAMKVLRMGDTLITKFPEAILNLENLEEIDFSSCEFLEGGIPDEISRLSSLAILKLACTKISSLPRSFRRLSHLRELDISRCDNLNLGSLPQLPSSLIIFLRG